MQPATRSNPTRRCGAISVIYLSGMLQGLTLVSFPASSAVLRGTLGFSDAQYGAIFLPQVLAAVIGAIAAGVVARRVGGRRLLIGALLANLLSQALLALASVAPGMGFALVLAATAFLGLGFGVAGAPLNSYPPRLFPGRRHSAVVALHTAIGLGLAVGPLLATGFLAHDTWIAFPLLLLAGSLALAVAAARVALPVAPATNTAKDARRRPTRSATFWVFVAVTVLYAFAEGTYSNWAVVYLKEAKQLPDAVAAAALSVFWGALVVGRLLVSGLLLRARAEVVWFVLPLLMIAGFLVMPWVAGPAGGIAAFALAGLACSAFLPITVALGAREFEHDVAWVSAMLIAALMLGVGVGSFVIGALKGMLAFESLYRISALYPASALVLMTIWAVRERLAARKPATQES